MKSKKKFEHELFNTVTNKINDNNLNYQSIKSRINQDYKKTTKLSFSYFLSFHCFSCGVFRQKSKRKSKIGKNSHPAERQDGSRIGNNVLCCGPELTGCKQPRSPDA